MSSHLIDRRWFSLEDAQAEIEELLDGIACSMITTSN
jgi:hypothetical protein